MYEYGFIFTNSFNTVFKRLVYVERLNTYLFIYSARDETVYVSLAYCQMNRMLS